MKFSNFFFPLTPEECSEEDVLNMFLMSFENSWKKGEVMYREFEEYYEGLSIGVNNDEDFVNILKNAWNIWSTD